MKRIFIMVSVAVLTLASCGTLTLEQSKVLNNADLASYKTFMIEPAEGKDLSNLDKATGLLFSKYPVPPKMK